MADAKKSVAKVSKAVKKAAKTATKTAKKTAKKVRDRASDLKSAAVSKTTGAIDRVSQQVAPKKGGGSRRDPLAAANDTVKSVVERVKQTLGK